MKKQIPNELDVIAKTVLSYKATREREGNKEASKKKGKACGSKEVTVLMYIIPQERRLLSVATEYYPDHQPGRTGGNRPKAASLVRQDAQL